jgi:hypothetical protein
MAIVEATAPRTKAKPVKNLIILIKEDKEKDKKKKTCA